MAYRRIGVGLDALRSQYAVSYGALKRVRDMQEDLRCGRLKREETYGYLLRKVFPVAADAPNRFSIAKKVSERCKVAKLDIFYPEIVISANKVVDTEKTLAMLERMTLRSANDSKFAIAVYNDEVEIGKELEWDDKNGIK